MNVKNISHVLVTFLSISPTRENTREKTPLSGLDLWIQTETGQQHHLDGALKIQMGLLAPLVAAVLAQ